MNAEDVLTAMEKATETYGVVAQSGVRVTRFSNELLFQKVSGTIDAITREKALEILEADIAAWVDKEVRR